MTDPKIPEGVTLTEVKITALTPDVIAAVMKKVTDSVMEAIPAGAIEKIAKEIITNGNVVREIRTSNYSSSTETKITVLSNEAKERFLLLVTAEIDRQVRLYFEEDETKKLISKLVAAGVKQSLEQIPAITADIASKRLGGVLMAEAPTRVEVDPTWVMQIAASLKKTQQALLNRNAINWSDIN